MSITKQELSDFHRFAEEKLMLGCGATLQSLLDEWNALREHEASISALRESVEQHEAGQRVPLSEAFDQIRQKLGRLS